MKYMQKLSIVICLGMIGILFTACAEKSGSANNHSQQSTFKVADYADVISMDPALVQALSDSIVVLQMFGHLYTYDGHNHLVPDLATGYKVNKDFTRYVFTLRKGLHFSNGDPLTAKDFVYSWLRVMKASTGSSYGSIIADYIKNGDAYMNGKIKDPSQVGLKALDPYHLQVTLSGPVSFFPILTTHVVYSVVDSKVIKKYGHQWTLPSHIACSGPYTLQNYTINSQAILVKNPYFYRAKNVPISKLEFFFVPNTTTAFNMFKNHEVNYVFYKVPIAQAAALKDKPFAHFVNTYGTFDLLINSHDPSLATHNIHFRRALSLAINRKNIVQNITRAGEQVAYSFIPPSSNYQPPHLVKYDVALAKKELKKSGFATKKPELTLYYDNVTPFKEIAEYVQSQWAQNLGLQVNLEALEWKVLVNKRIHHNFQLARGGWFGDYYDPYTFLSLYTKNSLMNEPAWYNGKYDELVKKVLSTPLGSPMRNKLIKQAETLLLSQAPIIPLYYYVDTSLLNTKVWGGYANSPIAYHNFSYLYQKKAGQK